MSQCFSFQWHITDECDQRCKHCYIFSGEGCKELKSMTWKQMTEVVANCEDFCKVYGRVPYFYITGGDPILHPDFWKLMVLLKSKKIPFTLMGNPFHLNDEICRMLKVCGCEKYQMSLDGMRETHDWFRKPGSFDLTIEKIGCLNRAGIKSVIMSTVSKTNMDEIPDIIDEVVKAKAKVFAFSRYVPTGGEVDTSMTPEEYRKLLEVCDAKYKAYEKAGCETYFNKKDHLWTLYEYETGQFKLPESTEAGMIYGGCNCGNCHITISSNGDIMACRRVTDSKVANIFEDRLADVWICQMEKYRDYDKFVKCSKCELKAWCRGCPAVANGTSGNFYGADPQCWKTKNEITGEVLSMLMDIIKDRHSIRKYTDEQIRRDDLEKILEAGNFAPNAGGGQRSMMVAIHNKELAVHVGKMNMAEFDRSHMAGSFVSKEQPSTIDDPTIKNGFYDAPTVICVFCQNNFLFKTADAFCMMENMILQATELGIASCIISRGYETFDSEEGRRLMNEWGVPEGYACQGFVILGYIDGEQPNSKPRKPGRIKIIE
ncbi:MAG: radical SAM/SPASM domain protein, ACGX system [Enterocloster sp.]